MFSDLARHVKQDAMNLGQLFVEQADQFIILLDGFQRFDEYGLAAGAGAMDNALHAAFLLDLYGDDEALAADGDQFILRCAAFGELAQISAQRFLNAAALLFDVAANAGELRRGAIFERAIGLNFVSEETQEVR